MQRELMSHNITDRTVGIENYNLHIFPKDFYAYNFSSTKKNRMRPAHKGTVIFYL